MATKKVELVTFRQFVSVPLFCYKVVGIEPYTEHENRMRTRLLNFLFYFEFINMNMNLILGLLYPYFEADHFGNVLEFAGNLSCLGFCLVASCKLIAVWFHKDVCANFLRSLEKMFPTSSGAQADHSAYKNLRKVTRVTILFTTVYVVQSSIFGLFCLIFSTVETVFLGKDFNKPLPYLIWYPWDESATAKYIFTYISQLIATYTAIVAVVAGDLLLFSAVIQLCMHFEYVTKSLRELKPQGIPKDHEELTKVVQRHTLTLKLCKDLNKCFSFSILCNFMTSSFIICMVGFQLLIGEDPIELFMYCMYMTTSLTQVFLICYFGERLQRASADVSYAAYSHPFLKADISYKKSIAFIIQRAQKTAQLKAASFPPITLGTFSKVISMSYQFFALLKTMYD